MNADELQVWLGDDPVAVLRRTRRNQLQLTYTEEALQTVGAGSIAMSVALPVSPQRYRGAAVGYWVESLLPEGELRSVLEQTFGVRRGDSFGLLLTSITWRHLVNEFATWPIPTRVAEQLSTSVLERLRDAVRPAAQAVPQVQPEVVEVVEARIRALLRQAAEPA